MDPDAASVAALVILTVLTVVAEHWPVRLGGRGGGIDLTVSTTFGLAAAFVCGPLAGAGAFAAAVVIADIVGRKSWWKVAVNAAIYAGTALVGSLALLLVSDASTVPRGPLGPREIGEILVAGAVFVVANLLTVCVIAAVLNRKASLTDLLSGVGEATMAQALLLAAVPVVMLVAMWAVWLLPVLLVPVIVARRNMKVGADKDHEARHDRLTGLANRFELRRWIERDAGSPVRPDLLLVDVKGLRNINDALGLPTGDAILCQIARRLEAIARGVAAGDVGGQQVARLDGDDFALLVPANDSDVTAARVHQSFAVPFEVGGVRVEIQASVGIATVTDAEVDAVLRRAEIAGYAARERLVRTARYTSTMDRVDPVRLGLLADLRSAFEADEIEVFFQPQVAPDGLPLGCEALVRWRHPRLGMISPDVFVPIAEQSGLVLDLTYLVLNQALIACRQWLEAGYELTTSVNLSPRGLHDLDLVRVVKTLLERYAVPAQLLVLEITESAIMGEPEQVVAALRELAELGVGISLDDYGTGYSSLSMLSSLPLDELKIDKSFVTAMTPGSSAELITSSTIEMAHRLGLRAVVEGVETLEVWHQLIGMGCDIGQGYLFRRPGTFEEVSQWLDRSFRARRNNTLQVVAAA